MTNLLGSDINDSQNSVMKSIDFPDFSSTWKEIIKEKDILIETLEEKLEKCELTISTHIATDNAIIDSIKEFLETNITVKEKKRLLQLLKLIKTNNNQSDTGDCQDEDAQCNKPNYEVEYYELNKELEKVKQESEAVLLAKANEIGALKDQLNQVTERLQTAIQELNDKLKESEIRVLKEEDKLTQTEIKLYKKIEDLEQQVTSMELKGNQNKRIQQQLEEENSILQKQLSELSKSTVGIAKSVDSDEYDQLMAKYRKLTESMHQTNCKLEEVKQQGVKKEAELNDKILKLNVTINMLKAQSRLSAKKTEPMQGEDSTVLLKELSKENNSLKKECQQVTMQCNELREANRRLEIALRQPIESKLILQESSIEHQSYLAESMLRERQDEVSYLQSKIKQLEKENNEEVSNLKENLSSLKAKVPNLSDHNWFKTEILNNLSLMNPKKAFYISNSMIALLSNWQTKIEIKMKQKVNGTD